MTELAQQKCQPYQSGSSPITAEEITALQAKIPDWNLLEYEGIPRLQKLYKFANFQGAIAFKFGSKTPSFSVAEDGLTFLAK